MSHVSPVQSLSQQTYTLPPYPISYFHGPISSLCWQTWDTTSREQRGRACWSYQLSSRERTRCARVPAPPQRGWWPGRKWSCREGGEGSCRDGEAVCNGMEIREVRENEMEKLRCTTWRNLAEMRLSSSLPEGGSEGKKQTWHRNSFVITSSVSSRVCIPTPLLCTRLLHFSQLFRWDSIFCPFSFLFHFICSLSLVTHTFHFHPSSVVGDMITELNSGNRTEHADVSGHFYMNIHNMSLYVWICMDYGDENSLHWNKI